MVLCAIIVFGSLSAMTATAATPNEYVLQAIDNIPSSGLQKSPTAKQTSAIIKSLSTVSGYNPSYTSIFSDSYICGDSIIYPLGYYNYVSSSNTSGKVGARLSYLEERLPYIIAAKPDYVVLHFGMNCLSANNYLTKTFIPTYKSLLKSLEKSLPDITIFVSCLFPCSSAGAASVANYSLRTSYNAALRTMCDENGWYFLNSEELVNKLISTMSSDGLHPYGTFYSGYWLKYVMMETGIMGLSIPGDTDANGIVQAADARATLRGAVGLANLNRPETLTSDMDGDGTIAAADARLILRQSVGLEQVVTSETALLNNLNAIRKMNGQQKLQYDVKLSNLAAGRALDMQRTGSTAHNTALYGLPFGAMQNRGITYTSAAECVVVSSSAKWTYNNSSDASFANYERIGIGFSPNGNTCVLLFTD